MSKSNYDDYDNDLIESNTKKKKAPNKNANKHPKSSAKKKHTNNVNIKNNKKYKRSGKAKFFMALTAILIIACIAVTAGIVCFYLGVFDQAQVSDVSNNNEESSIVDMITPKMPERTSFLIAGTDADATRTDTIMVGCYNSKLDELTLISIPRDTLVSVDDETYALMNEHYPEPGQKGMKINALYHYGTSTDEDDDSRELGLSFLQNWVEEQTHTKLDYTAIISFDAFTYLIDAIGGIEYDVPMRMYYKCEDLMIDLQPGPQTLNGEQAEGLVRFRHDYINGDIGRVEQQQNFMKAMIKQLGNKDTIMKKPIPFIKTFFKYVKTDMSISDATKLVSVFKNFNADNVVTYTLPGTDGSLYGISGGWIMNETEAAELFNEVFTKPSSEILAEREAAANADTDNANTSKFNDKELEIQVLNGSYTDGLATKTLTDLTSLGYKAMSVGDYKEDKTNNTRIYVKEDGMGQSLVDNFPGCEIIVDTQRDLTEKYDIVIVLGIGDN